MDSLPDLKVYLAILWRYRLVALCALIVGSILTVTTVKRLPDVYASTTLIMVEAQDVPVTFVNPTTTERLEQRLQAMNQEVMSRTRSKHHNGLRSVRGPGAPVTDGAVVEQCARRSSCSLFGRECVPHRTRKHPQTVSVWPRTRGCVHR
jgi:hypothetical protein